MLRDLTFEVEQGRTLVLLGRSGSGKTTALKMVNALLTPTSGEVFVEGRATTSLESDRAAPPHRLRDPGNRTVPALHHRQERRPGAATQRMAAGTHRCARQANCWSASDLPPAEFEHRYPRATLRRPAAARRRRASAGGRSAHSAVRRTVRRARSRHSPRNPQRVHGAGPRSWARRCCSSRTTFRKPCNWATTSGCSSTDAWKNCCPPSQFRAAQSAEARAFLASLSE